MESVERQQPWLGDGSHHINSMPLKMLTYDSRKKQSFFKRDGEATGGPTKLLCTDTYRI